MNDASPAPPVSANNNEEENTPEETLADSFEGENEIKHELLKEQEEEEGVRSLFSLLDQELL